MITRFYRWLRSKFRHPSRALPPGNFDVEVEVFSPWRDPIDHDPSDKSLIIAGLKDELRRRDRRIEDLEAEIDRLRMELNQHGGLGAAWSDEEIDAMVEPVRRYEHEKAPWDD